MSSWKRTTVRNIPEYRRNEDLENLLVFGYQSKLFRDDGKAKYLDQGRHLIPWMGDPSMMIDRYDGRGHLNDIWPDDADNPSNRSAQLTDDEMRMEQLCNEERYLELHTDVAVKQMYEEEELKRLNEAISAGYGAVGFSYDQPTEYDTEQHEETVIVDKEEEEPYYAPPELQLPTLITPPETVKQNTIIEKTALFISKQSAQMEIVIKMKQRDNPQFSFLEYNDHLNPYYKHVVKMLKSGKYKPQSQRKKQDSEGDGSKHYLHPSLSKVTQQPVMKEQTREEFMNMVSSQLPSGQIANTPYAKLLSNLTKHTGRSSPQTRASSTPPAPNVPVVPPPGVLPAEPPPGYHVTEQYDHYSAPSAVADAINGQPPPPGTVPPEPLPAPRVHDGHDAYHGYDHEEALNHEVIQVSAGSHPLSDLDGVSYDDAGPLDDSYTMPPPPDIQPIIDKMAVYVAKNGPEFELIVRRKNDQRFAFLNEGHVHNPYYENKKTLYQQEMVETKKKEEESEAALEAKNNLQIAPEAEDKTAQQNKSISFSLRSREAQEPLSSGLRTTALLYDSSDDEADNKAEKKNGNDSTHIMDTAIPADTAFSMLLDPEVKAPEGLERKQAENKLKDKLALAVREKLAQASKETHIKAERKRRAAMFINMLKSQPAPATTGNVQITAPEPVKLTTFVTTAVTNSPTRIPVTIPSRASTPLRPPKVQNVYRSRSRSPKRKTSSPSFRAWKSRSRSPRRRRKRSKTPPSSYNVRSSPSRRRRSPTSSIITKSKRPQRHSRSRSKDRRSKTCAKSPSGRIRKRSRSRSKTRTRRRSRSRTRKRSPNRKRSQSRSRKRKSKKKKRDSSKSPKKRKSDDKKSHSKSKSSREARHKVTVKDSPEYETVVIEDDTNHLNRKESPMMIESDSSDSTIGSSNISTPPKVLRILDDSDVSTPSTPSSSPATRLQSQSSVTSLLKPTSTATPVKTFVAKSSTPRPVVDMFAD